jgi:hypothetical protein
MHMIDVMKKLQEIAEDGYDNEDIQRGINAAGKHTVAEAQKAASEKVSNLYPSDPGQDDEGDDEGSNPRLNPDKPIQKDDDMERLKKTAGITSPIGDVKDTSGYKSIYNVDGSLADIAKDSGYTSIGGAKPAPDISVNPSPTPSDPGQDDEGDDEGSNPRLNPDPDIRAITGNDGDDEGSVNPGPTPSDPGQDDEGDDEGSNPRLNPDPEIGSKEWYKQKKLKRGEAVSQVMVKGKDGKMYPNPHEASLADQVYDYNVKQGKIQEVHEDEIDEAVVEVPVNELAELMQLAGYTDYAEKIEEYANEPDPEYMDAEEQLIGLSGGLNGPKKMYAAAAGGDNPMDQEPREVTESTFESFYKKYDKFVAELTESEQDK